MQYRTFVIANYLSSDDVIPLKKKWKIDQLKVQELLQYNINNWATACITNKSTEQQNNESNRMFDYKINFEALADIFCHQLEKFSMTETF